MTIDQSSSPAEMTEPEKAQRNGSGSDGSPSAKRSKKRATPSVKKASPGRKKSKAKKSKARPPKKSKRASKKASKPYKGVRTTTRSGKKITRAKAGGQGVLAAKGVHVLVVRVEAKTHAAAWKKAKAKDQTLNSWLASVIDRAAK